ncbi:hypothetical protein [Acinetobacter sp. MD2(2019)]|uniref:hypothetical protein n=1 Tax=Acinetobacter sp. MD2(2019) TaxID=2605273 RepID=UPI002D1F4951|nr:hypothetical protein [Acinetobacter sp. MD2(2019)]MEB3755095.1 hypothetical protein [Acinetobacter sp. MD2(2019)]
MSKQISPQYQTRAPKLAEPRVRVMVYLPQTDIDELDLIAQKTNRSRSSIIGERYSAGKAQEQQ